MCICFLAIEHISNSHNAAYHGFRLNVCVGELYQHIILYSLSQQLQSITQQPLNLCPAAQSKQVQQQHNGALKYIKSTGAQYQ